MRLAQHRNGLKSRRPETEVAQSCTLPYRRFAIGQAGNMPGGWAMRRSADYKSAIRQVANLRYRAAAGRKLGLSSAFTLIEVVISAALMALILTAAYMCLSAGIAGQKMVEPRADLIQNARVAMALLTADLRAACPISKDYAFLGMKRMVGEVEADNMDFGTHNYTPKRAHEGDFCQESFYLDKDQATGQFNLWRRRNPLFAPDPLSGGSKEQIAQGLLGAKFEYTDGLDWYDNWGEVKGKAKAENSNREQPNLDGMPKAVRITLLFDSNPKAKPATPSEERQPEPPLVFQTVALLNLAGRTPGGSSGATDSSTPTEGAN